MAGLGSVIGLVLGGTLTEYASWRWVLFINAPIAVAVLAATFTGVLVPGDREPGTLDVPGAITATLGIASLIYALTRGNTNGWADAGTLTAFALGAVLLLAFATAERFSRAPMLPAGVIRDRNRAGANAVMLLLGAGLLAMYYLLTLYLQLVRGYSALHTGLAYLPNVVGLGALAAIASAVTRSQQAGHTHAAALTNGYVAGLLTGAAIYAVGAIVAALAINARLSPGELAGHEHLPAHCRDWWSRSAALPGSVDTAWMPLSCRLNSMNAASMSYDLGSGGAGGGLDVRCRAMR